MLERIAAILRKHRFRDADLKETTELISDLGLNSLNVIEMIVDVEDEFDVEIPDRAIKNIKTVGDVIQLIESLQQ